VYDFTMMWFFLVFFSIFLFLQKCIKRSIQLNLENLIQGFLEVINTGTQKTKKYINTIYFIDILSSNLNEIVIFL